MRGTQKNPLPLPPHSVSITTVKREAAATQTPVSPPQRIGALLHVVGILLAYGRHLADTVTIRATAPSFPAIAACFGTIDLSIILARLHRGVLRAAALERVLLARAARGRDIAFARARIRLDARHPAPADAIRDAANSLARKPAPRPSRRSPGTDPTDVQPPTLEELERQVRRRPLGRTLVDICLDLAVVPGFCTGTFWNELFDVMQWYGGSVASLMRERNRREQAFDREQDRRPTQNCDWLNLRRQTVRQVLGFFIGGEPVLPLHLPTATAAAIATATGPP
jgi:hypothetical protein